MTGWGIVTAWVRRHWPIYLLGVTLNSAGSVLAVWIPRLLGGVADRLQHGALGVREAGACAVAIVGLGAARVAMALSGRLLVHRKGRVLTYQVRRDLLARWSTLSPAYYQRHGIGDLLSHALSDVEVIRELASMGINVSSTGLSLLAAVLYTMAVHGDWRLTLAGMAPLAAIPVLVRLLGPRIRLRSQRAQEALGRMAQSVEELVGGIRTVKAFGNEAVVMGRFERRVEEIVAEKIAFTRLSSLFGSLVPLMANLGFVVVLGYGGFLVTRGGITLGDFVAATLYVAMLRQPLEHLGQVLNLLQRAAASLDRVAALLAVAPTVCDRPGALVDRPLRGHVQVKGLTFHYPGVTRAALTGVSFEVRPGQTLGIVGAVGSGKTTLADLLLRLYDPPEGSVFIDGEDVLRYPLARLRQGMAYVPQDGFLFSTSVLENVGFSDDTPEKERAVEAVRTAAALADVERFAEGLETEIGERGVRLSGGQRQRLAIARAIYKDAPIELLDDSLSAVDTTTERRLLENLRERSGKGGRRKTTILISHRLSAVRHADEILVLDAGRVAERGDHARLIALGGSYAALWSLQSGVTDAESSPRTAAAGGADPRPGMIDGISTGDGDAEEAA